MPILDKAKKDEIQRKHRVRCVRCGDVAMWFGSTTTTTKRRRKIDDSQRVNKINRASLHFIAKISRI